jgi:hypothetical protein
VLAIAGRRYGIRVLGPVEASAGGKPVFVGAGKPRALLALLALNAGSTISTDRLVEGPWGEEPPATAAKMVQLYVSQLRNEIRRLDELRVAALELAIDGELAAGRQREVVGELDVLVAEHPLRERLHTQRMLALYRCGRRAQALDAYRQARSVLVEEIGVEPGLELRRLHEAILRQDPQLEPPGADAGELPPELDAGTPLVGREPDLDALREQSRRARGGAGQLALVVGARGMGKTRLAAGRRGRCVASAARCSTRPGRARRRRRWRCWRALGARGGRRCWCSTTSIAPARMCGPRLASRSPG